MAALSALGLLGSRLQAATVIKADNTDNLALGSSWVGGVAPAPVDVILWDSTVTGANTVSLGAANLLIGTVQITNPGGLVTLNGIGTLQLGANGIPGVGIDMSSATADLTINANIALEDSPITSSWTVAEGRTLTIAGNVSENGPANKILTITGAGVTRITGIISDDKKDDLSIAKSGTGTLILAAANTYSGDTTVNQGVLRIIDSAALGKAPGTTIVNSGGELQLLGNISIGDKEDLSLTGTGAGGPGSAALRNISGGNQLNGPIVLQDAPGVVRINSDSGSLALLGNITEDGTSDKILTFGGSGAIDVEGVIAGGADIALAKDGTGTLILTGNNSFSGPAVITGGEVVLSGNGGISLLGFGVLATSAAITVSNATLTLDNTLTNKNDRIGNRQVTLNGGTFNFIHGPTSGNFRETIGGTLILNSGASTIGTSTSAGGGETILTFASLARNPGATVNFGDGVSNPSAANDNNNVRFDAQAAGFIGVWATVGGTSFATYNTASSTDSVEALVIFDQTVTRLSSGTKFIANTPANNVLVTDGTGTEGNITLAAAPTTINTLTNSATGTNAPAGGVTIDPAGQALQVNGILNGVGSSALTIGTGTNNGTLTAKTAGGELIIYNFSSNAVTVNSVIANNTTASSLTKAGSGSVVLTGANTYTGSTLVNNGTLEISGASGALSGTSNVTVNTGGTLLLNSTSGDQINNSAGITLDGGTLNMGTNNNISETVGALRASLINSPQSVRQGSFVSARPTKTGAGTLTLSGNNTYTGNTTIDQVTIELGPTSERIADLSNVILNGGTLAAPTAVATGFTEPVNTYNVVLSSGTRVGSILDLDPGIGTGFTEPVNTSNGVQSSDTLEAPKWVGTAFTETVNPTWNTRRLKSRFSMVNTSNVVLNSGTLAAPTAAETGFIETVGTLTLSSSSAINMNEGSRLNFAASNATTWTGTLSIWNWNQGTSRIFFGNNSSALTAGQQSQISVYDDAGTTSLGPYVLDGSGELVPIPEPGAVLVGLLVLAPVAWRERRLFMRVRGNE